MQRIALTRPVPSSINRCELTHLARSPIDVDVARVQHAEYERALDALGCRVQRVPVADDLPDSVFIEDTAVVVDEVAVITRPGAESRRAETAAVADALRVYRPLRVIEAPATIDGGDVLVIGKRVFVGITPRTNSDGANQLRNHLVPFGYDVEAVPVHGCLHLKSGVTQIADDAVLINRQWISGFDDYTRIDVDPGEPFAANALRIGEALIYPSMFPRTRARLQNVHVVDASELAKAEGGVTCCSIVFTVA
jgi:dimethylargininase